MSFQSEAQDLQLLQVVDPHDVDLPQHLMEAISDHEPLEVADLHPEETHELEISDEPMLEIVFPTSGVAGAENSADPIEVHESEIEAPKETIEDTKSKKGEKWDWESKGAHGFVSWIKERCDDVPKHSGVDTAGLERAIAYLERVDNEISKAMRLDLDGELDANQIEKVRATIDDGIEKLHARLDKVKKSRKGSRKKKAEMDEVIIKSAQKITGVSGVYVMVPLLISGIARTCINSMVSAGHDIEFVYKNQVEKYKLNAQQQAEVRYLLFDMGYAMRGDRGYMPDEDFDPRSSDNYDYAGNFKG